MTHEKGVAAQVRRPKGVGPGTMLFGSPLPQSRCSGKTQDVVKDKQRAKLLYVAQYILDERQKLAFNS